MRKGDGKTYKAYRFRLYPSAEQEILMAKTFGCCRFLYNRMLADKKEEYQKTGKMLRNTPAQYKEEYEWLKEADSLALANTQLHLETAYRNFFRDPKIGFPKFKAKHHSPDSYTTNVVNGNIVLNGRRLRLPKMGSVRIIVHREIPSEGRLKSVTVTREPSGKFYASLLYEMPVCENQTGGVIRADRVLGVDFAMADLAVFSDGTRAGYPRYYRQGEEKLAREQRKLSRCVQQKDRGRVGCGVRGRPRHESDEPCSAFRKKHVGQCQRTIQNTSREKAGYRGKSVCAHRQILPVEQEMQPLREDQEGAAVVGTDLCM